MILGGLALPEACADEAASAQRMSLPFHARSVLLARAKITAWLQSHGCDPDAIDDVRLVVSELVGNAVRHGAGLSGRMLEVSWMRRDDAVVLCIADGGGGLPQQPVTRYAAVDATAGRGLAIVDTLSTRWWSHSADGVTVVHAQVPLA